MRLSTTTGITRNLFSHKETIKILADAGFDAYDISLTEMKPGSSSPFFKDTYLEYAKELRDFADSIGIVCNQAHAPFHSTSGDEKADAEMFRSIVRSMEVAAVMGADIIVVHPVQHLCYAEYREELFEMNIDFYNRLIPYAEKFGIKIATENMWQWFSEEHTPTDSVCSRSKEFCALIDAIGSEWVTGCLDIGHVSLMGADIPDFIKAMGNKRLLALHVHDTDFKADLHTAPFMANIDYMAAAHALGEIGYKGDFTFEATNFTKHMPKEFIPTGVKFLCDIGRFLMAEIEK